MLYYQVTKHLCSRNIIGRFVRFVNTEPIPKVLVPLKNRKLLKISGDDAPEFLQGLITNDMRHFKDGAKSVYAMFLNNKGRVLYDTLIHRWENESTFFVECDKSVYGLLYNHLNVYKLKRAVELEDVNPHFRMWALISQANLVTDAEIDTQSPINIYKDPRLTELGCRLITVADLNGPEVKEMISLDDIHVADEEVYKYLRYKLGVGEGPEDLPPGGCFPLEANCDYLHGVSFHKGCYIGQELTARIYHTGVIRKRMMPIKFTQTIEDYIEQDSAITAASNPKLKIGKLRGFVHDYGLGIVRIKEALEAKALRIGQTAAEIVKPEWWPIEAPKEKLTKTD